MGGAQKANVDAITIIAKGKAGDALAIANAAQQLDDSQRPRIRRRPPVIVDDEDDDDQLNGGLPLGRTGTGIRSNVQASLGSGAAGLLGSLGGGFLSGGLFRPAASVAANTNIGV